jgi:hypothetical protein
MGFDLGQFKNLGDLKNVWDQMPEKSWPGLIEAVQQVRDEKGDSESLNKAEKKAGQGIAEGWDFPDNPMELVKILGSHEASSDNK